MKNTRLLTGAAFVLAVATTPAYSADCLQRLDELRQRQAQAPLLDQQRPDLVGMRTVARDMAARGKEGLCNELVDELTALLESHRSHVDKVKQLANYATAAPVSEVGGALGSRKLVGMSVRNRVGDELGEVSGIDIDAGSGSVLALQVVSGGFLGINESQVAVPWNKVYLTTDRSAVVLDMTAEDLEDLARD